MEPHNRPVEPQERIRKALEGKTEGFRGENREREHVAVAAGDILSCCKQVIDRDGEKADPVVKMLQKGSSFPGLTEDTKVTIQADDAFHLLKQLGSIQT